MYRSPSHGLLHPATVGEPNDARDAVTPGRRVGLVGRGEEPLCVFDAVVPAPLRQSGWWVRGVTFIAEDALATKRGPGDPSTDMVVPDVLVGDDPTLVRAARRRIVAYLAGRYCAGEALRDAGCRTPAHLSPALPVDLAGAPAWPTGFVGSISHARSRAVAIVGRDHRWQAMGVDCEAVLPASQADEIAALVLRESDGTAIAGATAVTWPEFVTLGFSAKETLYKCLRPLVGVFFDFDDAYVTQLTVVSCTSGTVRLRLARTLASGFERGDDFEVGFSLADDHAYTWLALPRDGGPSVPSRPL